MEVGITVQVVVANPGTERLYLEILRNGTLVETIAVLYPTTSQTYYYDTSIDNYSNDVITMRFRYHNGAAPGNTIFRVDNATMFGFYY